MYPDLPGGGDLIFEASTFSAKLHAPCILDYLSRDLLLSLMTKGTVVCQELFLTMIILKSYGSLYPFFLCPWKNAHSFRGLN